MSSPVKDDVPKGSSKGYAAIASLGCMTPSLGAVIALYALIVAAFCDLALFIASTPFFNVIA